LQNIFLPPEEVAVVGLSPSSVGVKQNVLEAVFFSSAGEAIQPDQLSPLKS
jgi:hypothetical protein